MGTADDIELQKGADLAMQQHYMKTFMTDPNRRRTLYQIQNEDRQEVLVSSSFSRPRELLHPTLVTLAASLNLYCRLPDPQTRPVAAAECSRW